MRSSGCVYTLSRLGLLALLVASLACSEKRRQTVKIAINPWPGYEFLYLAERKGFFKQVGLDIELIQLGSLADAQRAYLHGNIDGLTSTIVEAVQANTQSDNPLKIVLVPDYSDGGDVIIARRDLEGILGLKGKTVGCEVSSLGIYILQRALMREGLSLSDVNVVNTEQMHGEEQMLSGSIDAFVTYPPVSFNILKHEGYRKIFSSAEIPNEIIDTVSVSDRILKQQPDFVPKFRQAWQLALDYFDVAKEDAVNIMAEREGISSEEFIQALGDLKVLSAADQDRLFAKHAELHQSVIAVCKTLSHVEAIDTNCEDYPNIIYQ